MELNVNGITRAVASPPLASLLTVLREELGITSPKAGCEQGACGSCTVLIDGEPRRSCLVPVAVAEGTEITTVEGLGTPPDQLAPVQAAFHEGYAAQCGYCTSGMLLAAHALIQSKDGPVERDEVLGALSGHVCRCTGYVKIVDAVISASKQRADTVEVDEMLPPRSDAPAVEIKGSPA